ncbi:hypothetical protein [Paenibacillus antarcticus]|uniref:Uncharacterized protein n=1 Tax=Paenibacillus antarcticus TaxID=253703 RepID=A0A168P474_9BACL|nr:hypothetical protein [Paenibacillus antarcticus]OAB46368.1 hypothetical protein PBAT_10070 [Paenibacillus antarcticus]
MKGGVIVSVPSKKKKMKKKVLISNKGQGTNLSTPNLTPQQISLIGALLAGFFNIDSVIYTRDNVLQVLLTTDKLTELPILGPPSNQQQSDILNAIDVISSNQNNPR